MGIINLTKEKKDGQHNLIIIAFVLMCSGLLLDIYDSNFKISNEYFYRIQYHVRDVKFFGACLLASASCNYKLIKTKVISFLFCLWSFSIIFINIYDFERSISSVSYAIFQAIGIIWFIRLLTMKRVISREPKPNEAYYIFKPINSFWGLLQAIFIFWYPPRYETRIISDGKHVWTVYRNQFCKIPNKLTDIDKIQGVRVPLGRDLNQSEKDKLNSMVGKKSIPGIRDCRKLLVVKI